MMTKAQAVLFLTASFLACTDGGEASLRIDARAIQALRSGLDATTGELSVSCADGRSITVPVTVDDTSAPITVYVPACGRARVDFSILSTVGVPELLGGTDTVLRPGRMRIAIDVRYVGQLVLGLDAAATIDSCVATLERVSPDQELVQSDLTLTKTPTTLLLPIGSYRVTCDTDRVLDTLVSPGVTTTGSVQDPVLGPRLLGTDLPESYPIGTQAIDATLTFSVPVSGVDTSSVILKGGTASISGIAGAGAVWTVSVAGLDAGTSYTLALGSAIVDGDGLPLVGAPVVLPFRVRANEYFVAKTGDDSLNDGSSPVQAWATLGIATSRVTPPALIKVAAGDYDETISMPSGVTLQGGWAPDFATRDLTTQVSRIRASARPVSFSDSSFGSGLDGMWLEGTSPDIIVLVQNASPRIENCVILGSGNGPTPVGYGLFIENGSTPLVFNNVFRVIGGTNNSHIVHIQNGGAAVLIHNTFRGGVHDSDGVFLDATGYDAVIVDNLFLGGDPASIHNGVLGEVAPSTLLDNAFAGEIDAPYRTTDTVIAIGSGDFGVTGDERYGGNVALSQTSPVLVSPENDARTLPTATVLNIGRDTATSDCGTRTAPLPCNGPTSDRLGRPRNAPTTVGAYEL